MVTAKVITKVLGSGFHRQLESHVQVSIHEEELAQGSTAQDCKSIVVVDRIEREIYIDLDEVEEQVRLKTQAVTPIEPVDFQGPIDIERPSDASKAHVVARAINSLKIQSNLLTAYGTVPIHLRYQKPSALATHLNATIRGPQQVFVACPWGSNTPRLKLPYLSRRFIWSEATSLELIPAQQNLAVPVGSLEHELLVQTVSTFITLFGALILLYFAWSTKKMASSRKLHDE